MASKATGNPATSAESTDTPAPAVLPTETGIEKHDHSVNSETDNDGRGEDGFIQQPVVEKQIEKGPFLIGKSDIGTERRITEAEFASVGIVQSTLTFEWKTGWKLPLEGINPEAVEFLVEKEYGFSVSDE